MFSLLLAQFHELIKYYFSYFRENKIFQTLLPPVTRLLLVFCKKQILSIVYLLDIYSLLISHFLIRHSFLGLLQNSSGKIAINFHIAKTMLNLSFFSYLSCWLCLTEMITFPLNILFIWLLGHRTLGSVPPLLVPLFQALCVVPCGLVPPSIPNLWISVGLRLSLRSLLFIFYTF